MIDLFDICGIPHFLEPWIRRFYEPVEQDLLTTLHREAMTVDEVCARRGSRLNHDAVERAWRRGVVSRLEDGRIAPADFHVRFEIWALFEGWQDLPGDIKNRLSQWELDYYIGKHRRLVKTLQSGQPRTADVSCPEYLLPNEVSRLLDRVEHFYLWPCNCRAMVGGCAQSRFNCIRFSNDRGIGWEISRERAMSIVILANKRGLMQSAEVALDAQGRLTGALCNCCNDCCFPHKLARVL